MATLDEFKANLIGGGARANQFRVTFNTPGAIATGLDVRKSSFLIKAAQLPGQELGEITGMSPKLYTEYPDHEFYMGKYNIL